VDDAFVYQSIPTTEVTWHSGTKQGNSSSVSIEICMNSDLDEKSAYDRAALLTAVLAYRLGIAVPAGIFQHHDWSGKHCPRVLRDKPAGWEDFLKSVHAIWKDLSPVETIEMVMIDDDHDHHLAA
jgi:N-acetylmuramoyl-L-alanine amidase CwlA